MQHLHIHTKFSTGAGIGSPSEFAKIAGDGSILAITDTMSLAGIVSHQKACNKHNVKPIFGSEIRISGMGNIVVLAKNIDGLTNLFKMTQDQEISIEHLSLLSHNCFALLGGSSSPVGVEILRGNNKKASDNFNILTRIFKDSCFFEIVDHGYQEHKIINNKLIRLGDKYGVKSVVTNAVRYPKPEDHIGFETLVCNTYHKKLHPEIGVMGLSREMWLKPIEDDIAKEIASDCNVNLNLGRPLLPVFEIPEEFTSQAEYLKHLTIKGLSDRGVMSQEYLDRAKYELGVIDVMGFSGYFLIVWDFIKWSSDNNVAVGPGRGSGAGSVVAYALGITGVDPIHHKLLFERFLNPERVSMPDFDIDFSQKGRYRVIDYVKSKYGEQGVSAIATFSEMKPKAAWKAAARACRISMFDQDLVSKLLPETGNQTGVDSLSEIFDESGKVKSDIPAQYEPIRDIMKPEFEMPAVRAMSMEGRAYASEGKHAAGVLIVGGDMSDVVPTRLIDGERVCQLDKDDAELMGPIKFDFLGLKELDVISYALVLIARGGKEVPKFDGNNLEDKGVYELLSTGNLEGIFQVSSPGLSFFLKQLKPSRFSDIVAATALYRPGPKDVGMHLTYMRRKLGLEEVVYDHDDLRVILGETYGVIVYQEQVMAIAQLLCGFSLGESDILRRAIGKKKKEELDKQKPIFVSRGVERGYEESFMLHMWELIETFSRYGFNKSHSVAYSMITYITAYLKRYFPAELFAAQLQIRGGDLEEISILCQDAKRNFNVKVNRPDIRTSSVKFTSKNGEVNYGLMYIRDMSLEAAKQLEVYGPSISSVGDLFRKVKVTARDLKGLVMSGAIDHLLRKDKVYEERLAILANSNSWIAYGKKGGSGQGWLFGDMMEPVSMKYSGTVDERHMLEQEKHYSGMFTTGHPVGLLRGSAKNRGYVKVSELHEYSDRVLLALLITKVKRHVDKNNSLMCFCEAEDESGAITLTTFSRVFEQDIKLFEEGKIVYVEVQISTERGAIEGIVERIEAA